VAKKQLPEVHVQEIDSTWAAAWAEALTHGASLDIAKEYADYVADQARKQEAPRG
jgi:hypothetical protein